MKFCFQNSIIISYNERKEFSVDWNKLKAEYIAGGTSYRKLAQKHGVSFDTLKIIAKKGKWFQLRQQADHKATTKMVDVVSENAVSLMAKLNEVADKLLDKISKQIDDSEVIMGQEIKHYTSALKDIKDIKGIKSDIDLDEQKARIDKLRKEAKAEDDDDEKVIITFGKDADKYAH
jgi:hypothetical protein